MKKFSMIKENNEVIDLFSNKNKKFKELIINDIDYNNKSELIETIQLNIDSLKQSGKTTLKSLQDYDDKIEFTIENYSIINAVLENTDWFNTAPIQMDITDIKLWLSKACDTSLLHIFNEMLLELK